MKPGAPREMLSAVVRVLGATPGAYALAGLIAAAAVGVVAAPISSLLTRLIVSSTGAYVVANTDLVAFFLSVRGLLVLLVIAISGAFSGQLVAAAGAAVRESGRRDRAMANAAGALTRVARRVPALLRLTALKVFGLGVRVAPFAIVIGATVFLAMRGYDLNYFVHEKPTSFWVALVIGGVVGLAGAVVLGFTLAGWLLAMPMCLFDGVEPRAALRESRRALEGHRRPVLAAIVLWHAGAVLASSAATGAFLFLASPLLDRAWSSFAVAAAVTGALVVIAGAISACGGVIGSLGVGVLAASLDRPGAVQSTAPAPAADPSERRRAVRIVAVAALALVAAVGAGVGILELSARPLSITVAAHRGASVQAPENTVAAVALAARMGAPWIEIDVQLTKDGSVVVLHDTDLLRIAHDPRRVADLTREEITGVDAGAWLDPKFAGERVPTLEQVIDAAGDRAGLFIELKVTGDPVPLARATLEVVRAKNFMSRCVFVSLSSAAIGAVRDLDPSAPIGLIFSAGVGAPELLRGSKVLLNVAQADDATIARYRRAGTEVYVWTITDPGRLAPLALAGVTGVLVDDPDVMLEEARRIGEMPELERLLLAAREKLRR